MTDTVTVADDGPILRATVQLDRCSPAQAIAAFTDADLLARWWGGELTAELQPGGRYSVWFPKIPARMTGEIATYTPGSALDFSWAWEHEPDHPVRAVRVRAEAADASATATVLRIEHGTYGEDESGRAARAEHREGWEFFLPRLVAVLAQGGQADGCWSMNQ